MNCTWLLTVYTWLQFDCRDNHTNNELNLPNSCRHFANGFCILKSIWLNALSKYFSAVSPCRVLGEGFLQFSAQTSAETLLLLSDSPAFHVLFSPLISLSFLFLGDWWKIHHSQCSTPSNNMSRAVMVETGATDNQLASTPTPSDSHVLFVGSCCRGTRGDTACTAAQMLALGELLGAEWS